MSLDALFTINAVALLLNEAVDVVQDQSVIALAAIGEQFVNDARQNHMYMDRTGNLTSSIGYVIIQRGEFLKKRIESAEKDQGGAGRKSALEFAQELALDESDIKGITLIGFAGMDYAAAVESKGFDVISFSVPGDKTIGKELAALLGN